MGRHKVVLGGVMFKTDHEKSCWPRYVGWLYNIKLSAGAYAYIVQIYYTNKYTSFVLHSRKTNLIRTFFFFLTACLSGSRRVTWAKSCRAA